MDYHRYDASLASAAQPSPGDLRDLKLEGWEAIVNLSPASTRNALKEEAAIVESLGMDYVHFPVDCAVLKPFQYETFRGIMEGLAGKRVLVHCGGNIKSSNLLYMYQVLEKGVSEPEAFAELLSIQNPESKWFTYFQSMGIAHKGDQL